MKSQFVLKPIAIAIAGLILIPTQPALAECSNADSCSSTLTNTPLPATSSALPNILLILDDSGSMATTVPNSGGLTRMQVAKSTAKTLIDNLTGVRMGLFSYSDSGSGDDGGELNEAIGELTSAKKTTLKNEIDALLAQNWTPLAETMSGIGRYFSTGTTGNIKLHPGASNEVSIDPSTVFKSYGNSTTTAPVQYWCQKNFAILITDGLPTRDTDVNDYLKEYYGYCTGTNTNCTGTYGRRYFQLSNITSGTVTTTPEAYETGNSGTDYLDDVTNALYDIDLRPDLVPTSGVKTTKSNVTTYTIAFADPALNTTTLLERAAKYGGGLYYTADSASTLSDALNSIKNDLLAKDGAAAAVAVANAHVTNTDNGSYVTSYNSGNWTGDLIAYPINTNTGVPNVNAPIWNTGCSSSYLTTLVDENDPSKGYIGCSAKIQLETKNPSSRLIFTSNDTSSCFNTSCGTPFTTSGLSTTQLARLNTPGTTPNDNADVISYIRGNRTGETSGVYRSRAFLLGDTINAEPLIITEPSNAYSDTGYKVAWICNTPNNGDTCPPYVQTQENRTRIILQPSNDGMVHAFNALSGMEEWAYIPGFLINSENDPGNSSTSLLNTRTRQNGFNHYYMVDATPVVGDADFNKAGNASGSTSTPDWRTIVVGGLGKGGRGYYALDLTSTTAANETAAASKVIWEFPRSIQNSTKRAEVQQDLGYTFGKPIITKTAAAGWVVLVTSGYNNGADASQATYNGSTTTNDTGGDGYGHLYVINPKTGDLIADLTTPQCNTSVALSSTNSQLYPCGLTHINGYVEDREIDNTTTYVYGGDLYGNVWRFDLTGTTVSSWSVTKLAVLRSGNTSSSPLQPITSVPELAAIPDPSGTGQTYYVYVGTGQYLDKNDLPCPSSGCTWTASSHVTQTQTMYGLKDPRPSSPGARILPDPLRGTLQVQTITTSGSAKTVTNNTVSNTQNGWMVDLGSGERIFVDPALAAGTLVFVSNIPSTEVCSSGGSSWLYALDYASGGQVSGSSWSGMFIANALSSRPVLIQRPDGKVVAIMRTSEGKTTTGEIPSGSTADVGRRISWRELIDQ